ncbi:MAG: hypothetical protein H0U27_03305 [Nitrosopumilus sp.]|nr:hypothetical protein [Nitrosopumilus sp.]
MKNLLTLHEAVAVVLLKQPNRAATFQTIAKEIERRNLFTERKGGITLAQQIKLRTSITSSKYKHWFECTKPNLLKLK